LHKTTTLRIVNTIIIIILLLAGCWSQRRQGRHPQPETLTVDWPTSEATPSAAPAPAPAPSRTNAHVPAARASEESTFYSIASTRLGYTLNGNENRALLSEVMEWLGTPYKYGGHTRQGIDCSGLVNHIYLKVYNINLDRSSINMARSIHKVNKSHLKEGDLVFFRINNNNISHVGIYISNNKFVHSSTSRGVIISDMDQEYYRKRFAFGGRIN
jgi:cell wall-associated NlpC family hydrolase